MRLKEERNIQSETGKSKRNGWKKGTDRSTRRIKTIVSKNHTVPFEALFLRIIRCF